MGNDNATICVRAGVRLWFAHSSEVPIYRQLVTQVVLAILCGDLKPGDRLPSTRELARRFALHPNTVSAGYRQLEREGWTERRRGSGVYVRAIADAPSTPEQILDQHIAGFFRAVRELSLPAAAVRARVAEWIAAPTPDHFVLIDPDLELRRILLAEIGQITKFPVVGVSIEDCGLPEMLAAAIPLCRPSKTKLVRAALPAGVELITLPIRSPNELLSSWLPAPVESMIGVVSHWPEFLETARTMLIAAGLSSEMLVFRDARDARWRRGLEQATAILCDAFTATQPRMPSKPLIIVSPVLAQTAAAELRGYTQPMVL
jgi:GntR family transcriptional regulator